MEIALVALVVVLSLGGSLLGTFTGLVPGIHVNTLASLMLVAYPAISATIATFADPSWVPVLVCSCIMSASVVHSFVDFVPSVFTGAPDPDEVMSILPGHRLLLEGRGMVAVRAAAVGSVVGASASILMAIPIQWIMMHGLAERLDLFTFTVVALALAIIIINEERARHWAAVLVILSGAMGYLCTQGNIPCSGILGENTLLFPLLTGMFGIPGLLVSFGTGNIPEQYDDGKDPVGIIPGIKGVLMGTVAGWYPGITSTAGASMASMVTPERTPEGFISLVASIGTVTSIFSIVTLSISGSGRSGTVMVIKDIIGDGIYGTCSEPFLLLLLSSAIATFAGYVLTIASGKMMSRMASGIDLGLMNKCIIILILALVGLLTGAYGLIVLGIGIIIGFIPIVVGCGRIPMAGCLMVPVLLTQLLSM